MQRLLRGFRQEHRLKAACALALQLLGLSFICSFFQDSVLLSIFGLLCTVLGLRFFFALLKEWPLPGRELILLLHFHPEEIVWVYSIVTERLPFGLQMFHNGTLFFKTIDGREFSLILPRQDLKPISDYLSSLLPHATFGYTKDREQWFMASPLMLLREEGEDT